MTTAEHGAFHYRGAELHCEESSLRAIAEAVGTPCYVYSGGAIRDNFRAFRAAFASIDHRVCYAVKANSNLSVLRLLKSEGSGFDAVSAGELHRLEAVGADPSQILFSGVGKTPAELRKAIELGLLAINVESLEELRSLAEMASSGPNRVRLGLRVNPDIAVETHPYISTGLRQHKFGVDSTHLPGVVEILKKAPRLELVSVGCHIGSQILEVEPFLAAFDKIKQLAGELRAAGLNPRMLNLGGGVGIPYRGESGVELRRYAELLSGRLEGHSVIFEPGRYVVGNAGVLVNRVLYRKTNNEKRFIVVDGAMNDLLRPSLYQAHHEIQPLRRQAPSLTADLVGPVCESGDFFARDREVPDLQPGDLVAVMNTGAYGFVLSSNYNSRPRAAEVLVEGDQFRVARRRETLEDLVEGER